MQSVRRSVNQSDNQYNQSISQPVINLTFSTVKGTEIKVEGSADMPIFTRRLETGVGLRLADGPKTNYLVLKYPGGTT